MKTILCYGDSNTHGHVPEDGTRYPYNIRWTGLLQRKFGEEAHVIEEGLNGRTTVWEDPIEEYKSGKSYLIPCLNTHKPIDVFVLMLGTNDLKNRFSLTASEIAGGCETLIKMIRSETPFSQGFVPEILLISPMIVPEAISTHFFGGMFIGKDCEARSREFAKYYRDVAKKHHCHFLDAAEIVSVSDVDYLHMDANGHKVFADAVYEKLKEIL